MLVEVQDSQGFVWSEFGSAIAQLMGSMSGTDMLPMYDSRYRLRGGAGENPRSAPEQPTSTGWWINRTQRTT